MNEAYLRRLVEDHRFFALELWKDRRLDRYAPLGEVELDILDWVEHGPPQRGVLAPRSTGKTHFGTALTACRRLFLDPDCKVIIVSKSDGFAKKILNLVRGWVGNVPFLCHLKPRMNCPERIWRDNLSMFDTGPSKPAKDPSVLAMGIEGQLEGCRGHILIADDVETDKNTETVEAREKLAARADEFTAVTTFGKGEVLWFGTPHHEDSLYLREAKKNVAFRTWPLLAPSPGDNILNLAPLIQRKIATGVVKPGTSKHSFDGEPLFKRSPDHVAKQKSRGRRYFAMQQMLIADMGDAEQYPLQLRDLIVFPVPRDKAPISIAWGTHTGKGTSTRIDDIPCEGFGADALYRPTIWDDQIAAYTGTKMWVDPSGRGADKTGWAVVSHLAGYLWAKGVGGLSGGYDESVLHRLATIARDHGVREIYVEDNFGQGMFVQVFLPVLQKYFTAPGDEHFPAGWTASIATVRVSGQKETRIIDALEPVMGSHRLIVDPSVVQNIDLQRQLTRITRQRDALPHEDELESLAMCVAQWQQVLRVDPAKAAERERELEIEAELRRMQREMGLIVPEPRWFKHH